MAALRDDDIHHVFPFTHTFCAYGLYMTIHAYNEPNSLLALDRIGQKIICRFSGKPNCDISLQEIEQPGTYETDNAVL